MIQSRHLEISEITDPQELARAGAQRAKFERNAAWLHEHASEVYPSFRGKYICIAGQQVFAAESAVEALALGRAAHPDDDGSFVRYIPREKITRIYANQR